MLFHRRIRSVEGGVENEDVIRNFRVVRDELLQEENGKSIIAPREFSGC